MARLVYNGVLLPSLPSDVCEEYPYALIFKWATNYLLLFSKTVYVRHPTSEDTIYCVDYMNQSQPGYSVPVATASTETEWVYEEDFMGTSFGGTILWANHDVLIKDTDEVWVVGSEPLQSVTIFANTMHIIADSNNPTSFAPSDTAELKFTAEEGYELPDTVYVTGASYTWDKSTGTLTLSDVTNAYVGCWLGYEDKYSVGISSLAKMAMSVRIAYNLNTSLTMSQMADQVLNTRIPEPETKTISPDFSTGDMVVTPTDGKLLSEVTIQKPDTLLPENIALGVNIASVVGTLETGGGGNGPLQAKTAYPSHSEQVITPDEDYYGLVAVTVKPVPRLPVAVVSVSSQAANVVETVVNLGVGVSVSLPSGIEYYYNTEQLLEIPADIVENYQYIVVLRSLDGTWRLYAAETVFYIETDTEGTDNLILPTSPRCRYDYSTAANAWYIQNAWNGTSGSVALHGGSNWAVWWSNFDIPNGSADAEEIYFPASTPQTEQPADATHFYYNGVRLPDIPPELIDNYPNVAIITLPSEKIRAVGYVEGAYRDPNSDDGNCIRQTYGDRGRCDYDPESDTWLTVSNGNYRDVFSVLHWANFDIPDGSATAMDIYFYGTLAVPDSE